MQYSCRSFLICNFSFLICNFKNEQDNNDDGCCSLSFASERSTACKEDRKGQESKQKRSEGYQKMGPRTSSGTHQEGEHLLADQ